MFACSCPKVTKNPKAIISFANGNRKIFEKKHFISWKMRENVSFVPVFTSWNMRENVDFGGFHYILTFWLHIYEKILYPTYRYTVTTPYLIPPHRLFHTHYSTGVISISHHTKGGGLRKKQFYITKVLHGSNLQKVLLNMTTYSDPNIESQPSKVTRYIYSLFLICVNKYKKKSYRSCWLYYPPPSNSFQIFQTGVSGLSSSGWFKGGTTDVI